MYAITYYNSPLLLDRTLYNKIELAKHVYLMQTPKLCAKLSNSVRYPFEFWPWIASKMCMWSLGSICMVKMLLLSIPIKSYRIGGLSCILEEQKRLSNILIVEILYKVMIALKFACRERHFKSLNYM